MLSMKVAPTGKRGERRATRRAMGRRRVGSGEGGRVMAGEGVVGVDAGWVDAGLARKRQSGNAQVEQAGGGKATERGRHGRSGSSALEVSARTVAGVGCTGVAAVPWDTPPGQEVVCGALQISEKLTNRMQVAGALARSAAVRRGAPLCAQTAASPGGLPPRTNLEGVVYNRPRL